MEVCKGCEAEAEQFAMVAVVRNDGDPALGAFVAVPVCDACWKDPAHQTVQRLKAHYFPRAQARKAAVLAGSDTLGAQ